MKYVITFIEKVIFYIGHLIAKPRVLFYYFLLCRNEKKSLPTLSDLQENKLRDYLISARKKTIFYKKIIPKELEIRGFDVKAVLRRLPVINKDLIKASRDQFVDDTLSQFQWKMGQTGGSTGSPFKYRLSKRCDDMAFAILYRGWGRGGYHLGDRLAVLAGGSLIAKTKTIKSRIVEKIMNVRKYSSYGVSNELFLKYYWDMKTWNPRFLQGYVSSIYEFARFIERNKLNLSFEGVFTTAEMLGGAERKYIEKVFVAKVYNQYGLNDGGISAFECPEGSMHIDMERGFLEVVDDDSKVEGEVKYGKLVATAFLNSATYFIRYDTGDLGSLSSAVCSCGSPYPVLENIVGRKTDSLHINGRVVGSPVLTVLMSHIPVNRYQFLQEGRSIVVIIDKEGNEYSDEHEAFIRQSLFSQLGYFDLKFVYGAECFRKSTGGKHRVVVRIH